MTKKNLALVFPQKLPAPPRCGCAHYKYQRTAPGHECCARACHAYTARQEGAGASVISLTAKILTFRIEEGS